MKRFVLDWLGVLFACALPALPISMLWAENNTTNTLTGSTDGSHVTYYVGKTGVNNYLQISGGGDLHNVDGVCIGYNGGAANNAALVTGSGSFLNNSNNLYVGFSGTGNLLTVANSGRVANAYSYIGLSSGADSNTVWVTDSGSVLSNRFDLRVGDGGAGNGLTVSHGGQVFNVYGYVGYSADASGNQVLVDGAGSAWSNSSDLLVGFSGAGNGLTITNSGRVASASGYLGVNSNANNNAALVTGSGSVWSNRVYTMVGEFGAGNNLTIADGGQVFTGDGCIGRYGSALNNTVLVTGSGSLWNNRTNLTIGVEGNGNRLTIANGGRVADVWGEIGSVSGTDNNLVLVTGSGSVWSNSLGLLVGSAGWGNGLAITEGGQVADTYGYIGFSSSANVNAAGVTGTGSFWNNSADLAVGCFGSGNSLSIDGGGWAVSTSGYIGSNSNANNNTVLVTGSASAWSNSVYLMVGLFGAGNSLTIADSGRVINDAGYIGRYRSAINNTVSVTGSGSVWNNGDLMIGVDGAANHLAIANSGRVVSTSGFIGYTSNAVNNTVSVFGLGSLWSNSGSLTVGKGSSNRLSVADGGSVVSGAGIEVGSGATASGNSVFASGTGTLASVGLTLGAGGARNNGITLLTNSVWNLGGGTLVWGSGAGAVSNSLVVDETSALTNIAGLTLGENDTAFHMTNSPGGLVLNGLTADRLRFAPSGFGGLTVGPGGSHGTSLNISNYMLTCTAASSVGLGSSNAVRVAGPGAVWSNGASLYVGNGGTGNSLTLANGGTVIGGNMVIGFVPGLAGNVISVAGGNLYAITATTGGVFDVHGGTLDFSAGSIVADWFYANNNTASSTNSLFSFGAGTLNTRRGSQIVAPRGGNFSIGTLPGQTATWNVLGGANLIQPTPGSTSATIVGGADGAAGLVNVTGAGTDWTHAHELRVGGAGRGSQLTVANGARTFDTGGSVGYDTSASDNAVLITDAGSLWSSSVELAIGYGGGGNSLTVTNSGQVTDVSGIIGRNSGAVNNAVLVTGTGTVWTSSAELRVGYGGAGNSLAIANNGRVSNTTGTIGYNGGADSNTVSVTGSGSVWNNSLDATIGNGGGGNRLTVMSGGQVADVNGRIGYTTGASGNLSVVEGSGSAWVNSADLYAGQSGSGNSLTIANSGRVGATYGYIGYAGSANSNAVAVTGSGSIWSNKYYLYVGYSGSGNSLTVSDSGRVAGYYTAGYIGYTSGANNNRALVAGSGSLWNNNTELDVGYSGAGNSLTIADGGRVLNTFGYIGRNISANSNAVWVVGAGSVWSNIFVNGMGGGDLHVGSSGVGNALTIANSGRVANLYGYIGYSLGANNNRVLVADTGSVWNVGNPLYVGYSGAGNSLTVTNGGLVANASYGYIGGNSSSSNNSALVTGAGSVWSNNNGLYVGYYGAGNRLSVTNGGQVSDSGGTLGYLAGANNNTAVVDGFGSAWWNNSYVTVGDYGVGNGLTIANGGRVGDSQGHIGDKSGASNNTVFVTGDGSVWSNSVALLVGNYGAGNHLTIANSGRVASSSGWIGYFVSASNNTLLVTGSGSAWNNSGELDVGAYSVGNSLTVTNGGRVVNLSYAHIGATVGASNNTVLVTGSGSVWSNSGALYVGTASVGNGLTIADGGRVANTFGSVGDNSSASGNTVLVTGAGSVWSNSSVLYVGLSGARNSMIVSNGGQVNASSLYVGYYGSGNRLTVSDGGAVNVGTDMFVGYDAAATNSRVLVAGGHVNVTGTLTVRRGVLELQEGWVVANSLLVATNGTLAGVGGITDPVTVQAGGLLSPGNSPGTLTFGSLTLNSGAAITSDIASPSVYDRIVATNLTVTGRVTLNVSPPVGALAATNVLKLVDVGSYLGATTNNWLSLGGTNLLNEGATFTLRGTNGFNYSCQLSYAGNGAAGGHGNDVVLTVYKLASGNGSGIDFQSWLALYNLPTNGSADFTDADGDGMNNWQEYSADTNPTNRQSVLAITGIAPDSGGMRLYWQGGVQATQYIETIRSLVTTDETWRVVFTNLPPTALTANALVPGATNSVQFYRIKAER